MRKEKEESILKRMDDREHKEAVVDALMEQKAKERLEKK